MKQKYRYFDGKKEVDREYSYIPFRYLIAVLITLLEVAAVIAIVMLLCVYVPYFYILCYITSFSYSVRSRFFL